MTKSYDNLYPAVCAFKNLGRAFRKAAKGKRGNPEVAAFEYRLESNLSSIPEIEPISIGR